jgi:prepilin-type N-terminal cleavage/methylation domain-containing protein
MDLIETDRNGRRGEDGFTLVETLVAIVVLVFGLMAVTNLLLVAATSNTVANQATAAAASASEVMDTLRSTAWADLPVGGDLTADTTSPSPDCRTMARPTAGTPFYNCDDNIQGVGTIKVRWQITAGNSTNRLRQITVMSEGQGALAGARSRSLFTTYRSCTQSAPGSCGINPCCLTD